MKEFRVIAFVSNNFIIEMQKANKFYYRMLI